MVGPGPATTAGRFTVTEAVVDVSFMFVGVGKAGPSFGFSRLYGVRVHGWREVS